MKRKRQSGASLAVNLFPFLAVLICTMGVLIVMLVMAVNSSQVRAADARDEHHQKVAEKREELLDQLDLEQFRVDEIEAMRPDLVDRLGRQRSRRSHLEDESRRLRREAVRLQQQWAQTSEDLSLAADSHNSRSAKIRSLESLLQQRKTDLAETREQVAGRPLLYSIIPTESAGGTARRPIYVECRPDGLFLQPAGIRIGLDEFTIPVVAGNPLDAALLATREHWNRYDAAGIHGDPYPLLVVRPGGATAYGIARRAMKSWDDEFGYELVENTRQIDWGIPEPELSVTLKQALRDAAVRQQRLVAMRQVRWLGNEQFSATGRAGNGSRNRGFGRAETGSDGSGDGDSKDYGYRAGSDHYGGSAIAGPNGDDSGSFEELSGSEFNALPSSIGNRSTGNRELTTGTQQQRLGHGTGQSSDRVIVSEGNEIGGMNGTTAEGPFSVGSPDANIPQNSGGAGNSNGSNMTQSDSAVDDAMSQSLAQISPLSETRGQDWALPTRTQGATAYRRPIRIECSGSEFTIYNSDPARPPVRVPLGQTLDQSVDALIHQIWNQIEEWGMAEAGGYWKPVLRISADRQGSLRAAELARKLDGSGIEIKRQRR